MKNLGCFQHRLYLASACVALFLSTFGVFAQETKQGKAVVRAVRGTAKYSVAGSEWSPLKAGISLKSGTTIQTGPESNVDLFLDKNGPFLRLVSNTTLSLDTLTYTDIGAESVIHTGLTLRAGRLLGDVKKLAPTSKYEIKTPSGIAGVRGTQYDISADGTITVVVGTVIFAYIDPTTAEVQTKVIRTSQSFKPGGTLSQASPELIKALKDALAQSAKTKGTEPEDPNDTTVIVVEDEPYVSSATGAETN